MVCVPLGVSSIRTWFCPAELIVYSFITFLAYISFFLCFLTFPISNFAWDLPLGTSGRPWRLKPFSVTRNGGMEGHLYPERPLQESYSFFWVWSCVFWPGNTFVDWAGGSECPTVLVSLLFLAAEWDLMPACQEMIRGQVFEDWYQVSSEALLLVFSPRKTDFSLRTY